MIFFDEPLFLVLVPVFLLVFFFRMSSRGRSFIFPSNENIGYRGFSLKLRLTYVLPYITAAALVLGLIAMAGPKVSKIERERKSGIGIVLAVDCSSSMLADDLKVDYQTLVKEKIPSGTKSFRRIDAVKMVAKNFVEARPDDLIGVVAFAAEAFVLCPLTFQHRWAADAIDRAEVGLIKDATAIGSAVMSGLSTLKDLDARTRVIVLLTDGINNFGTIPPLVAAKAARTLGVKIYTVGLVSSSGGFTAAADGSGRKIYTKEVIDVDEPVMREIAAMTGGRYFRAEDMKSLAAAYDEIDLLEKTDLEKDAFSDDVDIFQYFTLIALALVFLETILSRTVLLKIP